MPSLFKNIYLYFLKSNFKIEPAINTFVNLLIFSRTSRVDFDFKISIKKFKKNKIKINSFSSPIVTRVNYADIPKSHIKINVNNLENQKPPVKIINIKDKFISIIRKYDLNVFSSVKHCDFYEFETVLNNVEVIKYPQVIDEIVSISPYVKNVNSQMTLDIPIPIRPADKKSFTKTEIEQLKRQLANANKTTINNITLHLIYPGFLPENYRTIRQDEETNVLYCYFNEDYACKKCSNYYLLMGLHTTSLIPLRALAILRKK